MTLCDLCTELGNSLSEEDDCAILFSSKPTTEGHLIVVPKEHIPILEMASNDLVEKLFLAANKASSVLFESGICQGTNILIQNGVSAHQSSPHLTVHVIPRNENDGINLQWKTSPASESDLASMQAILKEAAEKKAEPVETPKMSPVAEPSETNQPANKEDKDNSEDLMIRQLERIP